MTWRDRLGGIIDLTSPDGNVFQPLWSGNSRALAKKLGIFEYPELEGTIIQDLGSSGLRYPLTLFFEGTDNDVEAGRFFDSLREMGLWSVVHPVRGSLRLQLAAATERMEPVKSGNLTVIETEWIEPIDPAAKRSLSTPQLAFQVEDQTDQLNEAASEQFNLNSVQDAAAETLAIESSATDIINIATARLSSLYESVPDLNSQVTAVIRSIQTTITRTTIDTLSLAGQVQNLMQLPILATNDIAARLSAFGLAIADIIGLSPSGRTTEDKNIVAVQELAATAAIASLSKIVVSGQLSTRPQALDAIDNINSNFVAITNALDLIQTAFQTEDIDFQYFSQSASYSDATVIVGLGIAYLLLASFDLAIEKRFTLEQERAPIEITITEYGTLGENDLNFDIFLDSNNLVGKDRLILPAGKEVVVYV